MVLPHSPIQHYIGGSNKFNDKRQKKALYLEKEKYSQLTLFST